MLAAIDEAEAGNRDLENPIHGPHPFGDRVLHLSALREQSAEMQGEFAAARNGTCRTWR